MKTIKGIAWNHTRGFVSVVATAQRFEELNPEVSIIWEKRSLQAFADASMETLTDNYDLIVMDHPHTAEAAVEGFLLPLDEHMPATFLNDQSVNSVGGSHESYEFNGKQWTLATDAAAPIATYRPDIVKKLGLTLPQTWENVIELAKSGYVTASLYPLDVLMHLYSFCDALGESPFQSKETIAQNEALKVALAEIKRLKDLIEPKCISMNPIRTAEYMSQTSDDRAAYCPFAYGYSNYSRNGYAKHLLKAANVVAYNDTPLRTTLGGAGLAVSSKSQHPEICAQYAMFTASEETQKGLYFQSGGQPGHRKAWTDTNVNETSSNFFSDTLNTLDRAFHRPKYANYMHFQDNGTLIVDRWLQNKSDDASTISELNKVYRESLSK